MTAFTDEVREAYGEGHKFGSRRAAVAWLVTLAGAHDEETGDAIEWTTWMGRIGRTIVETDSQGFVYASSFAKESDAIAVFQATDGDYGDYLNVQEEEALLYRDGYVQSELVTVDRFLSGDAVTVDGWDGIAFRVDGLPVRHGPDYEWSGIIYQHPGRRLVHMVGDDREFDVDVDDLSPLADDDYCGSCGQIGCPWC